jgi:hypothetical protein
MCRGNRQRHIGGTGGRIQDQGIAGQFQHLHRGAPPATIDAEG